MVTLSIEVAFCVNTCPHPNSPCGGICKEFKEFEKTILKEERDKKISYVREHCFDSPRSVAIWTGMGYELVRHMMYKFRKEAKDDRK